MERNLGTRRIISQRLTRKHTCKSLFARGGFFICPRPNRLQRHRKGRAVKFSEVKRR